jgi:lipoate-protein ligase A
MALPAGTPRMIGRRLLELGAATPPAQAVALDDVLAMDVGAGRMPPMLRVWQCSPALVVPRRYLRRLADAGAAGWPACGRSSGGEAVALGPGVVCVSLILPMVGGTPTMERAYALWLSGVRAGIQLAYGIHVSSGRVPGSFCDGRYNAVVDGRKLGGTAQSRRHGSAVVHGCLLVDVDPAGYCRALDALAGEHWSADADGRHVVALRQVAGRVIDPLEFADAIADGFAAAGLGCPQSNWDHPRPDELDRARELAEKPYEYS